MSTITRTAVEAILKDNIVRILIVTRMLHDVAGGVERSAITLLNRFAAQGHEVALLTWDQADAVPYYELSRQVAWHRLDMGDPMRRAGFRLRLRRLARIRQRIHRAIQSDVVIAFQHGPFLTVALALLGTGRAVIAAERNAPDRLDHLRAGRRRWLLFQSFRLADRITVQFEQYRRSYPAYLRKRIRVVPNVVDPPAGHADPRGRDHRRVLLSVGRIAYQKNPHCLVRAFAEIAGAHPDWVLRLVGSGEDRTEIDQLISDLNLGGRVELPGTTRDVGREYRNAQLFALASRWEGFPNAIAEALAHGLPVVGFEGCAGVGQLVETGRTGLLAAGNGDHSTLAHALDRLMGDPELRVRYGEAARAVVAHYSPAEVVACWERVAGELASGS